MASKKELEQAVKDLKNKNYELQDKILQLEKGKEEALAELSSIGFSVIKQNRQYKLVKLQFSPETGQAKVTEIEDIDRLNTDYSVALMNGKRFLVEEIFSKFDIHN